MKALPTPLHVPAGHYFLLHCFEFPQIGVAGKATSSCPQLCSLQGFLDPMRHHSNIADDETGSGGLWGISEDNPHEQSEVAPVTWIIQELATRGSLLVSVFVEETPGSWHCEGCQCRLLPSCRLFAVASAVLGTASLQQGAVQVSPAQVWVGHMGP